jgi:hypothetical protein
MRLLKKQTKKKQKNVLLRLLNSYFNFLKLLASFNFLKLFAPLNFLPLDPSPSDTFLSLSLFNSKYLIDFSFFDINRHISGLNCKGIETNNLNKSLHNKTDTLSNLSK